MDFLIKNIIKTIFTVLLTLIVIGALIWGFVYFWQKYNDSDQTPENTTEEQQTSNNDTQTDNNSDINTDVPPVQTTPDELIALPYPGPQNTPTPATTKAITFTKTATIVPEQEAAIFPQASGVLNKLNVKVGDQIKAGQVLGQISNSVQLEQAAASLESAVKSLDIAKQSLYLTQTSNQITSSTFDEQLENANIGIQNAINQLTQTRITKHEQADQENLKSEIAKLNAQLTQLQSTNVDQTNTAEIIALQTEIANSQSTLQQIGYSTQNTQFYYQDQQFTNSISTSQNQLQQLRSQLQNQAVSGQLQELNAINQINQISLQIASYQSTLKTGTILSTIGGIVSKINLNPGETANPSQPILTITNPDSNIIEAQLTIHDVQQISPETTASIQTELGTYPGQILFVSPIPDPNTKLITVKIGLSNNDTTQPKLPAILTNSFAKITFTTPPKITDNTTSNNQQAISFTVPINQVEFINKVAHVAVIENNLITYKPVVIGKIVNGRTEIISGLEAGIPVVISPKKPIAGAPINLAKNNG